MRQRYLAFVGAAALVVGIPGANQAPVTGQSAAAAPNSGTSRP